MKRDSKLFFDARSTLMLCFLASIIGSRATFAVDSSILNRYWHIDPKREINRDALEVSLTYFDSHLKEIMNQDFMTVIDFTLYSGRKRFHLINLKTGVVESLFTTHGKNSDPENTGYADRFSNRPGSLMSSLGPYYTADTYQGDNGLSLNLHGQAPTNNNAYERRIVVHGSDYVGEGREKMGRSWGCPALARDVYERVIALIKNGSLLYIWSDHNLEPQNGIFDKVFSLRGLPLDESQVRDENGQLSTSDWQ